MSVVVEGVDVNAEETHEIPLPANCKMYHCVKGCDWDICEQCLEIQEHLYQVICVETDEERQREELLQFPCGICFEKEKEVAFVPCGHYVACRTCADAVLERTIGCPWCRQPVTALQTIFTG